jgi:Cu(I)/Ag(I) efflux system periplasmic protein CusF
MKMGSVMMAMVMVLWLGASPLAAFAQQADLIDGQVTKIDKPAGKITIKHGPLKKFGMEDNMTMVFRVQEPGILEGVRAGDKIKFEPERINGQFTVTKIEKAEQ